MENDNTDAIPTVEPTPDIKVTAYGYPGDSTPDYYSSHGIGDHQNDLSATPDHQSVALTHAQRMAQFGYERIDPQTGKHYSTGLSFTYKGTKYWDDDTAPEGDYRIDVFNPDHPPDKLSLKSGHEHDFKARSNDSSALYQPWTPPKEEDFRVSDPQSDSYSEPEEHARPKVGNEDDSILAPQNMIKRIRSQFPQYAKVGDQKLWDSFKAKFPTGLSQLRTVFPEYKKVSDDKFLKAIREKFFSNDSDDEFIDRVNPPSGIGGIYHSIAEQMPRIVSGWYQGTSELGKFPQRAVDLLNRAVVALGIDKPTASGEAAPFTKDLLSGIVDPNIAQKIYAWGQKQAGKGEAWTQKAHIPQPQNITGQAAAKAFQGLGAAPAIIPAFAPGVEALPALVLGMTYDAIQGEGKAREKGLDNSLMFGAEGLSYRALQEWFLHTPRGRALSAVLWAGGGMADQEAQALLTDPKGELKRAFTQPVNMVADLLSTGAVNALFGSIFSTGADKLPPVKDVFFEAVEARKTGDYKTAAQLLDKTMLLLPDIPRKAVTNNLLAWRNEAIEARPGDTPAEMPGQRGFLVLQGTLPKTYREEVMPVEPQHDIAARAPVSSEAGVSAPYAIQKLAEVNPEAAERWKNETDPDAKQRLLKHLESVEPKLNPRSEYFEGHNGPDGVTDQYYYSGIDIGKAFDELGKRLKPVRELFIPEHETAAREAAGGVIGKQIGIMQRENQRMAQSWWRKQNLEDEFKFAYEADHRRAFWAGIPKGTAMRMFEQHEAGMSTGNRVADRMFQLHDGLMKALARIDQERGFRYNLKNSYIYHALEKSDDIIRLQEEIRKRGWGDPDFMHAREIPTVEMLHALGFKLKTYNLEDLDQMRLEASNRAEMRASSLEALHGAGLALSRFDMAKLEKTSPALAKQIREQVAPQVWRSPRASGEGDPHQTYWVHKDADFMLHRATDPVLWHPVAGAVVQGLNAIKQRTIGLNLAWSLYHQLHMLPIGAADTLSSAFSKSLAKTANLGDWARALEDALSMGGGTQIRSLLYNQKLLNWYFAKGDKMLANLSPYEQKMFELQRGGGFVPLVSHERQIQIGKMLMANSVGKVADKALDLGYAVLSGRPYQQWLFGRAIPSMKMYSYDRAALALLEAHPEFNRPQYRLQRDIELRKIRDQVDARYGEQNFRQSFADPHIKYIGQAVMLSYSWLKSFIDVYGGGLHDLTRFIRNKPVGPQATNRIAYMMTLSAMTSAANMLIAHFVGAGVQSLKDLFYPNIGYDKDGKKLIRVKPPFWITTEFGGWAHDVDQMGGNWLAGTGVFFANKMQPALSTIVDLIRNKDYYGTDISPTWDNSKDFWTNFEEQVWSKAEFALKQGASFTIQSALKPGSEPRDVLLQMIGLPRAPAYAERSDVENHIIRDYVEYNIPAGKRRSVQDQMDARREYRMATQSGDGAGQQAALEKMRRLGITEKSIKETEKTANETEAQRLFSHMKADEQRNYWKDMSPEEKAEFGKFLRKELKKEYGQ